jgi:hypothetical protein
MSSLSSRFEIALDGGGGNGKHFCDFGLLFSLVDGSQDALPQILRIRFHGESVS